MPTVVTKQDSGEQMADPGRAPVVLGSTLNNKLIFEKRVRFITTDRVCPRSARHRQHEGSQVVDGRSVECGRCKSTDGANPFLPFCLNGCNWLRRWAKLMVGTTNKSIAAM